MPNAIVTGASRGLGLALARVLSGAGWRVTADARGPLHPPRDLVGVAGATHANRSNARPPVQDRGEARPIEMIRGDITDPAHRQELIDAVEPLDLLINNAGALGPSPLPRVALTPLEALRDLYETNVLAPLALTQLALPKLRRARGILINITSDAAVEAYEGWGGYGSSKAALERLGAVLGAEEPEVLVWQVDPGDLRTTMHQDAFPGKDISDRPLPETIAPALLRLLDKRPPSGRYRLSEWA